MIVEVSCEECGHVLGYTPKSEFPDRAEGGEVRAPSPRNHQPHSHHH